jgi:hypothetical protein
MNDEGYAVHVTDSVTGHPVAIFAYPGEAEKWAEANYPGRYRVESIRWQERMRCPRCHGAGESFHTGYGLAKCPDCRGTGDAQ